MTAAIPFLTTRQLGPRRTEVVARENLFGPTGNEGLAQQLFDLCQSNDPRAWEQAQSVVMEMAEVLTITHREFIRRTAAQDPNA